MSILNLSRIGVKTGWPERLQASTIQSGTVARKRFWQAGSEGGRWVRCVCRADRRDRECSFAKCREFWRDHNLGVRSARENDVAGME